MIETSFRFRVIAENRGPFVDFAPYVPSTDPAGRVAFQAALEGGGSGIFVGDGGSVSAVGLSGDLVGDFTSHPDLSRGEVWCAYARLRSGVEALVLGRAGELTVVARTGGEFSRIGPLGPTMNDAGAIAFRADTVLGGPGVFRTDGGSPSEIPGRGGFAAFHGLPVINDRGQVVYRADRKDGTQVILGDDAGGPYTVAEADAAFADLGKFPCLNAPGAVAFSATARDGTPGVFLASNGRATPVVALGDRFESIRGALVDDAGKVLFFATPTGGTLGVYDSAARCVLSMGGEFLGSKVVDFALNPVSINSVGQFAVRIKLASQRHLIVRADPAG